MKQDLRTIKIRNLNHKLEVARSFIRELAIKCVSMEYNNHLSRAYWGEQAIRKLEYTKEDHP